MGIDTLIQYALAAYGFLLERKVLTDGGQFAGAIRAYSTHARSHVVAQAVEASGFLFSRAHDGAITAYRKEQKDD